MLTCWAPRPGAAGVSCSVQVQAPVSHCAFAACTCLLPVQEITRRVNLHDIWQVGLRKQQLVAAAACGSSSLWQQQLVAAAARSWDQAAGLLASPQLSALFLYTLLTCPPHYFLPHRQAVYTAGVLLPKPVAECQYWHRSLNPKKLISIGFRCVDVLAGQLVQLFVRSLNPKKLISLGPRWVCVLTPLFQAHRSSNCAGRCRGTRRPAWRLHTGTRHVTNPTFCIPSSRTRAAGWLLA